MDPSSMHLENIVVHLFNVFLVFLVAAKLTVSSRLRSFPYLSALLFGLHPINSESVNWIAGRTDVYAGMFVFLAVYYLIRAVQEQSTRFALLFFGVSFLGMLTKETAIMLLPAAFIVIIYWPVDSQFELRYKSWRKRYLIIPIVITLCIISSIQLLVYSKGSCNNALSMIFDFGSNVLVKSIKAYGFYIKKFFLPLPLNVAITDVNNGYIIVGVIIIASIIFAFNLIRIGIPGIFLISAILFLFPALVVATTDIAWTPYGERYLYIPSAFAVIGCLELFHCLLTRLNAVNWLTAVVSIIIAISAAATFQRAKLWGDNLALLEDVVTKSPDFGVGRNEYGVILKQAGRLTEAENQFKIALKKKNSENVNRIIRLNLIWIKIAGKQPAEVRRILLSEIGKKTTADSELLKQFSLYNELLFQDAVSEDDRIKIAADIIETNEILYTKTHDSHYLYRSGQMALSVGNNKQAAAFFRQAWETARPDAFYREPARKLAEKLAAK
jgi:tetratricopeptide (TPR) repeat protein